MASDIESHVNLIRIGWEQCTDDDSIINNNNTIVERGLFAGAEGFVNARTHTLQKIVILWGYVLTVTILRTKFKMQNEYVRVYRNNALGIIINVVWNMVLLSLHAPMNC